MLIQHDNMDGDSYKQQVGGHGYGKWIDDSIDIADD